MTNEQFKKIVERNAPKKHRIKNAINAFLFGGLIGLIAEGFFLLFKDAMNYESEVAMLLSTCAIVIIAALLTGFSLFNNLAKVAGAGLFVPTTGFANSMISSSIDAKFEGPIQGVGSKMFYLAGSVITYGVFFAFIYTFIRWILSLMGVPLV